MNKLFILVAVLPILCALSCCADKEVRLEYEFACFGLSSDEVSEAGVRISKEMGEGFKVIALGDHGIRVVVMGSFTVNEEDEIKENIKEVIKEMGLENEIRYLGLRKLTNGECRRKR